MAAVRAEYWVKLMRVYKVDSVWRWECRVPLCEVTDWRSGHVAAYQAGRAHLYRHARFGFRR